jgi:hypothetical protein
VRERCLGRECGLCAAESIETARRKVICCLGCAECDVSELASICGGFLDTINDSGRPMKLPLRTTLLPNDERQ